MNPYRDPGFVTSLKAELDAVEESMQQRVHRVGALTDAELVSLTTRMDADPALYHPDHATLEQVAKFDSITFADEQLGDDLIKKGEVAFVVLAGGAGTRMGGPKLFAKIPGLDISLLGWKLLQAGNMPVWVMTSPDMLKSIQRHVSSLAVPIGLDGVIFEQFEGYRLTPDNRLHWLAQGVPDMYPLGHGDVGPALVESGVLDDHPRVKHVIVCNVDNVLASPHPGIIGQHYRSGCKVTCELVERQKGDRGGVPAWVNNHLQIAEDFRLPEGFADESPFHNTNTMVIDADVLRMPIPWRWHRVRKDVNGRLVIQYERLLQQYTEECATNFVMTPRDARYAPVKTPEDLERAGKVLESYRYK
jgi:UTP--glucose-1-phosphate uridylyltransferase